MKLHVGWDFDGLFVEDRGQHFLDYLLHVEKWVVDKQVFSLAGNWNEATGKQKPELDDAYNRFLKSSHAPPIVPVLHARPVLHSLRQACVSHLVTSRKDEALSEAVGIIEGHFGVSFASYNGGLFGLKLSALRKKNIAILVDDNPHEARKVVGNLDENEKRFVVQFPSFHLGSPKIEHPNILRLPICDDVHDMVTADKPFTSALKSRIFEESWLQVAVEIQRLAHVL